MNQTGFHEDFSDEAETIEERAGGYEQLQEMLQAMNDEAFPPLEEFTVEYTTTHRVTVKCRRDELADKIANINIPEDEDGGKYVSDTFEVTSVSKADGTEIPVEEV